MSTTKAATSLEEQMKQAGTVESQAAARLQEMETEIARLPQLIQAAEKKARGARDEETVLRYLTEKEQLEKRARALPYLLPQARGDVLRARAEIQAIHARAAASQLPTAESEMSAAQSALEEAQKQFTAAEAMVKRLRQQQDNANHKRGTLLQDAESSSIIAFARCLIVRCFCMVLRGPFCSQESNKKTIPQGEYINQAARGIVYGINGS